MLHFKNKIFSILLLCAASLASQPIYATELNGNVTSGERQTCSFSTAYGASCRNDVRGSIGGSADDKQQAPSPAADAQPDTTVSSGYTGLWWNKNEPGWGMSITQQGPMIFVAWYTYDQSGNPTWYVMSSCPLSGKSCTGSIYKVTGGTPPGIPWNGSGKIVTAVGTGTLAFADNNTGTFNYSINGAYGAKNIEREIFATGTVPPAIDFSGLWWNPNESGWGVALAHQYNVIFAAMYVYDAAGKAIWYVASNCVMAGNGCSGDLYQVNGGSAPTTIWNGENRIVKKVGTANFAFTSASAGTVNYTINGVNESKNIVVEEFYTAPPSVSPYAGNWSGSYSGSDQGNCTMTIASSGTLSGSCNGNQAGYFTFAGAVDAQGKVSFHLGSGNSASATFSGSFVSTSRINGTWANPYVGYSGTWVMTKN